MSHSFEIRRAQRPHSQSGVLSSEDCELSFVVEGGEEQDDHKLRTLGDKELISFIVDPRCVSNSTPDIGRIYLVLVTTRIVREIRGLGCSCCCLFSALKLR